MPNIVRDMTEITRCGAQYRADSLAPLGLKGCHASYLIRICGCPGISQDKLAQQICINKSNVARQAALLEEEGFITRRSCTCDKRVMELYPTQKALDTLPLIQGVVDQWRESILQDLSEAEQEQLSQLLAKVKDRATAWMNGR